MQKNFKDLSEREILALAISLEEEDPFLMKNVVLLAASFYLLKQDVVRASLPLGALHQIGWSGLVANANGELHE